MNPLLMKMCAKKTIFTFSFPATLTFDLWTTNFLPWFLLPSAIFPLN